MGRCALCTQQVQGPAPQIESGENGPTCQICGLGVQPSPPYRAGYGGVPELLADKDVPNGYAGLDENGLLKMEEIPDLVELTSNKNEPDGYAGLDGSGLLSPAQMPPRVPVLAAPPTVAMQIPVWTGSEWVTESGGPLPFVSLPAPSGSASTDVSNLEAAAAEGGIIFAQAGTYQLNAPVTLPAGTGLFGLGSTGSGQRGNTTFKCTTSTGALIVGGSGPLLGHFYVDGNSVATAPFQIGDTAADFGAQRLFDNILVGKAAQDNWTVQYLQNSVFNACAGISAGRDNLVMDGGCGGLQFLNFESLSAGRYGVRSSANNVPSSSYGLYNRPSRIQFLGGRSEGCVNYAAVELQNGYGFTFDNFDMVATNPAFGVLEVLCQVSGLGNTSGNVLRDVGFSYGGSSIPWPIYIGPNADLLLDGYCIDYTGKGANVNSGGYLYQPNITFQPGPNGGEPYPFAL